MATSSEPVVAWMCQILTVLARFSSRLGYDPHKGTREGKGKATIRKWGGKMRRKSITQWGRDPGDVQPRRPGDEDLRLFATLHRTRPASR